MVGPSGASRKGAAVCDAQGDAARLRMGARWERLPCVGVVFYEMRCGAVEGANGLGVHGHPVSQAGRIDP